MKNAMEPTLIGPSHSDHHVPVLATDPYHSSFDDLLSSQRVAMYTDSGGNGSTSSVPEAAMPVASYIPSTSQVFSGVQARFLNFSIEYRDRTIPLVLKDTEQVGGCLLMTVVTPYRHEDVTFETIHRLLRLLPPPGIARMVLTFSLSLCPGQYVLHL